MLHTLYADRDGNLHQDTHLTAVAGRGSAIVRAEQYIPLPDGATLSSLPGRAPLGYNAAGELVCSRGKAERWAVGALLPQGFSRTLNPAYTRTGEPEVLPLLGYTAVAMQQGKVLVAALQTDEHRMWHPRYYNTPELPGRIARLKKRFPDNRIVSQLARCSLQYGCFTAQNFFYRRFEGGLPVSPACNARCLGCISLQESECCKSAQGRIDFKPTVREGTEVALYHLSGKRTDNIISFGQGCEGEPSLAAKTIAGIIRATRDHCDQGAININTNAGSTADIRRIVDAGLDTMRVSIISATEAHYNAYYRPRGYSLADVEASLAYAVERGVYVSLNLLTLPGFNDREREIENLRALLRRTGTQKVQIRNLNIDEDWFYREMQVERAESPGVPALIAALKADGVAVGNYTTVV